MKRHLLHLLKLEERPTPPPGFGPEDATFRASEKHLYYRAVEWVFKQLSALVGLLLSLAFLGVIDLPFLNLGQWFPEAFSEWDPTITLGPMTLPATTLIKFFELFAVLGFLFQLCLGGLLLKMSWELHWYMIGEESIRIRGGLWKVHEQTMTIANIQNLVVRQGPLQKLLGIGDLEVHTAGGGGKASQGEDAQKGFHKSMHVGLLRGLEDPWHWRDHLRERMHRNRGAGLGDDSEERTETVTSEPLPSPRSMTALQLSAAALELRDAARALRRDWATSGDDTTQNG